MKIYLVKYEDEYIEAFLRKLDAHQWASDNLCADCGEKIEIILKVLKDE